MPYARPSLSDLRNQVAQDIAAALPGADPLLRYSNLGILANVLAGLAHLHYGYLDWTAMQANPFTATDEFLEAWAGLKGVTRQAATQASGTAAFAGTNGTVLPAGTAIVRGDGKSYTTLADGTVAGGVVSVPIRANADSAGLLGAAWNSPAGTALVLGTSVAGITASGIASTVITGGADLETDDSLRARMLLAYQQPAHGGSRSDYILWARQVPGVTRAWCNPHPDGAGTVSVYVMLDSAESAFGGFPQGTDGVATGENRGTAATGDQLTVANYILPLQPVTALVTVRAPVANTVGFMVAGLSTASTATKAAVTAAIRQVLLDFGSVGGTATTVLMSYVQSAVAAVPNTAGFLILSPSSNIVSPAGSLPVLGTVTFT